MAQFMADNLGYSIVDFKAFEDEIKKGKGTEDEPFEGEIP